MRFNSNDDYIIIVSNFTPVVYENYRIGVPENIKYNEVFNSDRTIYGGSGQVNSNFLKAQEINWHNQPYSIKLRIPPLATIFIKKLRNKT
jgi:1,4-alpha-glucan branching enzyme